MNRLQLRPADPRERCIGLETIPAVHYPSFLPGRLAPEQQRPFELGEPCNMTGNVAYRQAASVRTFRRQRGLFQLQWPVLVVMAALGARNLSLIHI